MRACGGCSISACRSRAPTGDDGLITGERRQLLLTISDLPDLNRAQVETVAAKDGVPLDALYGVLRALGTAKIPEDPTDLEKLLDAQAEQAEEDDGRARCAAAPTIPRSSG